MVGRMRRMEMEIKIREVRIVGMGEMGAYVHKFHYVVPFWIIVLAIARQLVGRWDLVFL